MNVEPLGPQVLQLSIPTYLHHGTADENTLVQPVYDLEVEARKVGNTNLDFQFYQGLGHELTRDTVIKTILDSVDRLLK